MSTTHIQPLPNVYGRMAYTELGEGKKRTENIQNGTNRIAAQMGDGDSREEFVRFCSAMKRQNQGRENEGFEVRVSWHPRSCPRTTPRTSSEPASTATCCARRWHPTPRAGSRSTPTARAAAYTSTPP